MISFIILPVLLDLFSDGGDGARQIEVYGKSRRFGTIDSRTISVLNENRQHLESFYKVLHQRLVAPVDGGAPDEERMAALNYLEMLANIYSQRANSRQLADNWLLAQYARSRGIEVTQNDVIQFLTQLTGGYMTDAIFREVLRSVDLNEKRLEYLITHELLASRMRQSFEISVSGVTPATQWGWFQRMNRQVTAEVAAVPVDRFLDKVGEPTEGQLRAFFEKHRDKGYDPTSPESGFVVPNKIAMQYVRIVPNKAMLDSVTDADIEKYYNDNKETKFLKPVRPVGERPILPGLPGQDAGNLFRPNLGGFTQPLGGASVSLPRAPILPTLPPSPAPAVTPKIEVESAPEPTPETKPEEPKAETVPPAASSMNGGVHTRFVSYQTETEAAPASEPATEPVDETAAGKERSALTEDAEEKPVAPPKTEEKTETPQPAEPPTISPAVPQPEPPIDLSILYRPLEEVKDEIRQTLAMEKAEQAKEKVEEKMRGYFQDYNVALDAEAAPPAMPDLTAFAAEQGLELITIELDTFYGAVKSDFARGLGERGLLAGIFSENPLLFEPESFLGDNGNYLYWVTEAVAEFKPTKMEDVRDLVVQRWKESQAQTPAMKYAEELAAEAKTSGKSLRETFESKSDVYVVETEPFFWKSYGPGISPWMAILNRMPPPIGEVCEKGVAAGNAEIDNKWIFAPGNGFMETAYALQVGETAPVFNAPKTIAYVVRVTGSTPSDEVLWERFQLANPMEYRLAGQLEFTEEAREAWMKSVYEEIGFEWLKDPRSSYGE